MVACGLHRPIRSDVHHDDLRAGSRTVGADLDGLAEQRMRHRVLPAFERHHRRGHRYLPHGPQHHRVRLVRHGVQAGTFLGARVGRCPPSIAVAPGR